MMHKYSSMNLDTVVNKIIKISSPYRVYGILFRGGIIGEKKTKTEENRQKQALRPTSKAHALRREERPTEHDT